MIKEFPIALSQNIFAEISTFTCRFISPPHWEDTLKPDIGSLDQYQQAHIFAEWARPRYICCGLDLWSIAKTTTCNISSFKDCIPLGCINFIIAVRSLLSLRKWYRPGGLIWKPRRRRSFIEVENCKLGSSFLDGSGVTHFIQSSRMKSAIFVITAVLAVSALTSANRFSAVWTITTNVHFHWKVGA